MNVKIIGIIIAICVAGFMVRAQVKAPQPQALIKETGLRVVINDGNQLYAWCVVAERVATLDGRDSVTFSGSPEDQQAATSCWAYIEGVIDSTPAGGEFSPGPDVRVSQYVDVILAYLKSHANVRDQPAASLVQRAVREAFPHR